MFDQTFKPFIMKKECDGQKDPLDQCVHEIFTEIKQVRFSPLYRVSFTTPVSLLFY